MEILEQKLDNGYEFKVIGRLDASTSNDFEEKVIAAIENGETEIIVNFSELDYISSSGLRVLLVGAKKLKALSGSVTLSGLKKHIKEVFEIAGFTPLFTIIEG